MKFINGDEYQGDWHKDTIHGQGIYTFNGRENEKLRGNFYYGEYRDK